MVSRSIPESEDLLIQNLSEDLVRGHARGQVNQGTAPHQILVWGFYLSGKGVGFLLSLVACSWSSGKDSCLACYKAINDGYRVSHLVNSISKEYGRVSFHGTQAKLVKLQAEAIGIPLLQKETTRDRYEQEFKEAVKSLIPNGVEAMVFGDIYTQEHRDWVHKVCGDLGIKPIMPLWKEDTEKILLEFIDTGFEAIVVSAKSDLFDKQWVGRRVDREFLSYLQDKNIDACGENGEFHTLVVDGPLFKKKIVITESKPIIKEGFWKHWFLDIKKYETVEK